MTVNLDGRTYEVFFTYGTAEVPIYQRRDGEKRKGLYPLQLPTVSCLVTEQGMDTMSRPAFRTVASGCSYCSPKDRYDVRQGNRIALRRALETLGLSRRSRQVFWTALNETDPQIDGFPRRQTRRNRAIDQRLRNAQRLPEGFLRRAAG